MSRSYDIEELRRRVDGADRWGQAGESLRARRMLVDLLEVVDHRCPPKLIQRCHDIADRLGARDLQLHYALCYWSASRGLPAATRAVAAAAAHHSSARQAAYRIAVGRARIDDWLAIAAADTFGAWPQVDALAEGGRFGARSITALRSRGALRAAVGDETVAWVLSSARVTRAGRSLAVGSYENQGTSLRYVPALSIWDCSAALRWSEGRPAVPRGERIGLLATQFLFSGYWHWVFEGLLKAVRLDEHDLLRDLDRLLICIGERQPWFAADALASVGIPLDMVEFVADPFDLVVDELIVPAAHQGAAGIVDEDAPENLFEAIRHNATFGNARDIQALRRRLNVDGGGEDPGRRVLISRRDALKRRIVNEASLASALEKHGFVTVVPGELTFREQVEVFASADIVVAPHGAALANLVFARPGSAVLELHHPSSMDRPLFRRLAKTVGLRYESVVCSADAGAPGDIAVDVAAIVPVVLRLVGAPLG